MIKKQHIIQILILIAVASLVTGVGGTQFSLAMGGYSPSFSEWVLYIVAILTIPVTCLSYIAYLKTSRKLILWISILLSLPSLLILLIVFSDIL